MFIISYSVESAILWCADAGETLLCVYNLYAHVRIIITSAFLAVGSMPIEKYGRSWFDY